MNLLAKFTDSNLKEIVSPLFGINYWVGLLISLLIFSTLFIFKGFYAQISKFNLFRYSLGSLQLILYFLDIYFRKMNGENMWTHYMPFHLSSLLDLTSAFLLLCPSSKVFSLTFPLVGPVILAFLFPDKKIYGLDSFFYYSYYLNHLIIFFGFFYLYSYGHVHFNQKYLKQTLLFITCFALFVFSFNAIFNTNYLFIGPAGFSFSDKYWILSTGKWNPIFRFLFMWSVGFLFVCLFKFLINKYLPPFYFSKGQKLNQYYLSRVSIFNRLKKLKRW